MHLTESNNLLSKILYRSSYEVDRIVNYQKPVMHIYAMFHLYSRILGVMASQIIGNLRMVWVGKYCCQHTIPAFCQYFQDAVIHIVVYKYDSFYCFSN